MTKAIALFSGGLDSTLAIKIIQNQGIEMIALHFIIPFDYTKKQKERQLAARRVSQKFGIEFLEVPLREDFLDIIKSPRYGFGKNLNPCLDCKILMLKRAKEIMDEKGAQFIVTGEVLSQRPKSQFLWGLNIIDRDSELKGIILRPLTAKHLPPTVAELQGWVKREDLYNFSGRVRKPQFELAVKFGITDYPTPAGGCLLTDPLFSRRVKDLLDTGTLTMENAELLKLGRHFRITSWYKLIVGRDESENNLLLQYAKKGDVIFQPENGKGPTGIGKGCVDYYGEQISGGIIAHYTKSPDLLISILEKEGEGSREKVILCEHLKEEEVAQFRIETRTVPPEKTVNDKL
ncbi:MAG: 7-cyano-7-deazaguanine synthase [Candidatus Atribacteria bacterium]|nr:7-cyano-7-deazaguanine synthase [Candidatus Atribacteria bacterium]